MRLTALPDAGCDRLQDLVLSALDARLDRGSQAPVALGLSGGGDSLALLHMAAAWCAHADRPLLALTVDHGLHPDSGAWTRTAGEMARTAGAGWRPLAWTGPKPVAGLPAAARAARHRLLAEAARRAGARVILLAHTADDALEADRMRAATPGLGRMRTWAPSPVWPQGRGVALLRPLLGARRPALRGWLTARGLAWIEDPANVDGSHPRIRARRDLVEGAAVLSTPSAAAAGARADADGWGTVSLSRSALRDAAPDARRHALLCALACAAGAEAPVRGAAVERLSTALLAADAWDVVAGGARVIASRQEVRIGRELGRRPPARLPLGPAPQVWDGRFSVCADEPGWTVRPLVGHACGLPERDRRRLAALPPALRPACPAFFGPDGEARLADGARLTADALAPERLDLALGRIGCEADLG